MRFNQPLVLLYALAAVILLTIFSIWAERAYGMMCSRFANSDLLEKLTSRGLRRRRWVRFFLDVAGICLIGLALSGPQWGQSWQQKTVDGIDILIAIDLSKSMLANDIKPNRISYVKSNVRSFLERLDGDRAGLIGFSGDSFTLCPITADFSGVFLALDYADTGTLSRGGTSIESAIMESVRAFSAALTEEKALILISDGEETEGDAIKGAEIAKRNGIEINCIGIGSTEGTVIRYADDNGMTMTIKDKSGNVVISKLDEDTLMSVANITGGIYVNSSPDGFGLDEIYTKRLSKLKKRQTEESLHSSYVDRYQYPLALGLICVFLSALLSMSGGNETN